MQSAGGFIIDDLASVFNIEEPNGEVSRPGKARDDLSEDDVATPKPLTPKQEAKLRSFLDASLDTLSRGYRKRFDPTSPLTTLTLYLTEWRRVIGVLARVPPYGSGSTNLLVSYLLRCSTDLCDGIAGYGLGMEIEQHRRDAKRQKTVSETEQPTSSDSEVDEEEDRRQATQLRHRQLNLVLQMLDLIDRIWAAILRGNLISFSTALANSIAAYSDPEEISNSGAATAAAPFRSKFEAARLTTSFVASPALHQRGSRESLPVHGGKGQRTVGVTDQVRLRNIAISSREKLFAWMRTELDAQPPPTLEVDPGQEPPDNTIDGIYAKPLEQTLDFPAPPKDESDDSVDGQDGDMEDVDIQNAEKEAEDYDRQEDTAEHRHFQDLFDRRIDPDEDETDEEDDVAARADEEEADNDDELGASVAGSVAAVRDEGVDSHKRKRDVDDEADTDLEAVVSASSSKRNHTRNSNQAPPNGMSRSEIGSLDISLSDGVGQWDLAFTRLFSKTLRTLSDLSEFTSRQAEPKSASSTSHNQLVAGTDQEEDNDD